MNTANPELAGSWWPSNNAYGGATVSNPYGTCNHTATPACAYMYGYAKAYDDANIRGVSTPSAYLWWLDVETVNSWSTNKTENTADLEGMTPYFRSIGADVGLYSTTSQWGSIVGTVASGSNLHTLKSWIPGATTLGQAKTNCGSAPLTPGGSGTLTQYGSGSLDYDYSCN